MLYEFAQAIWLLVLLNLSFFGCLHLYSRRERRLAAEKRKAWREAASKEEIRPLSYSASHKILFKLQNGEISVARTVELLNEVLTK